MKFLLDTDIAVGLLRKNVKALDLVSEVISEGDLTISLITYAELIFGTHLANDSSREETRLKEFLERFKVEISSLTLEMTEVYAKSRYILEKRGERLDNFDLLIASTAVVEGATLVTNNIRHFERFPGIKLYNRT